MIYTVASLIDMAGDIFIDFVKDGNQYTIYLRNKKTNERYCRTYDTFEEAEEMYLTLTRSVLKGCMTFEQRKDMLNV